MFDSVATSLTSVVADVRRLDAAGDDAGRVEQIRVLEELKRAASAAQARITADLVASQRADQVVAGVPVRRAHRGVGEQVALARGVSPHEGGKLVGMATALAHEMPCTMAALADGRITEWTATCLVRETAVLQAHDRTEVDARLAEVLAQHGTSTGRLTRAAKALAQKLDPESAVNRAAKAETDRTVTIRPAPDTMVYLTALVPVAEGVACFAALRQEAATAAATGDPRSRGQVMADGFVARVTGRDPLTEPVPVHVDLVMTDTTLLGRDRTPATVHAKGQVPVPIPGPIARTLVARAGSAGRAWLRRLYTTPDRTALVAMDSRSRRFPELLAHLVRLSDQSCRTPWCDAPIAETDHVEAHADHGPTTRENAQGLCRRCNLAKQAPGWSAERDPDGTVRTTTPTGHTYTSHPPPVLGHPPTTGSEPVVQLNHAMLAWHRRTA